VVVRTGEEGENGGVIYLMGTKFCVCTTKGSYGAGSGDGHTAFWMDSIALNYIPKRGEMANIMLYNLL
jgi:hypothetical protein